MLLCMNEDSRKLFTVIIDSVCELNNASAQCLSQDLDFFSKKGVIEIFRELFTKDRSYSSRAKIAR